MFRILVFGHASFAEGLVSAAVMIAGEQSALQAVCAPPQGSLERLTQALSSDLDDRPTVVLCDLAGGAPWRAAMEAMRQRGGGVLSGANLPMLLELLALCQGPVSAEQALAPARRAALEGIQ